MTVTFDPAIFSQGTEYSFSSNPRYVANFFSNVKWGVSWAKTQFSVFVQNLLFIVSLLFFYLL